MLPVICSCLWTMGNYLWTHQGRMSVSTANNPQLSQGHKYCLSHLCWNFGWLDLIQVTNYKLCCKIVSAVTMSYLENSIFTALCLFCSYSLCPLCCSLSFVGQGLVDKDVTFRNWRDGSVGKSVCFVSIKNSIQIPNTCIKCQ